MALVIVLSIGAPLCLVVVILGCLNCFMKRKPGFSPFANPNFAEEGTAGRNNDAFAVDMEPTIITPSNESHVEIEPIPDVTPKVVSLPPLRPKILSAEKDSQNASLSFFSSHRPFPRENLTYLNPLGVGWFGQVIQSEALRISTGSMRSQVVVKMLKDDASSIEEKQFIDEVLPFRHLDHQNVISLLGQCTESRPYLYIVEYAPHGDLKSFLQSYKQDMDALLKKNKLLHFCLDAAAGIACIHRHNFVHCDLSTRNCLVMSDYKIKIGDYGFAEQSFKEDYFQSDNELLPIRWMAPECLIMKEGGNSWTSQNYSKASDMWSFGVLLWEMFSMAEQPYDMLTDEAVLQGVFIDKVVSLADIPLRVPFHDRLSALMGDCWKGPAERISIESAHQILDEMSKEKVERVADELDFDQKWNHLIPNTQSRSQSLASEDGSAIALAGSFSSGTPSNIDDKPSSAPLAMERETSLISQPNIDEPVKDVFPNPISLNAQSDFSLGETIPDQIVSTENVAEVDSVLPHMITPSKKPIQQMTTSTPLADKSVQNKTPSFITAPNTPNSQYVTAEEGSTADSSVIESGSASQVNETQGFDSLTSSEGDKTVQESEIETPENSVKDDSSPNNVIKEESSSQISHAFDDFVSFNSDSSARRDNVEKLNGVEVESSKPHELDASFDIIVPSMLDKDQHSETTSQQAQTPSSSQNASFDFMTDFAENDIQSVAADKNVLSVTGQQQPDCAQNELDKSVPHKASDNLSFESGALQSSASNPFNSSNTNPFSTGETTSPSSQDAAIFFDKSEIDASSSLNSSSLLGGWDTSFAESHEQAKDAADKAEQSNNSLPFTGSTEGPKEESSPVDSSDFSFVEAAPVASDTGVVDSTPDISDSVNNTTTESLLSGFEPPVSNVNAASSSPSSQIDDMFGSPPPATTAQPSPFFNDEGTKPATVDTSPSSDPFDFSAFETNNIPNAPETQQKPAAEIDIFSSGFNEFSKADNGQEQKLAPSSSSDFPGLDIFSSDSSPAATNPESAGLMLGGDLLTSVPASGDNQVSSTSNVNSTSSPPMDLLGLGFDPITPAPNDTSSTEQSLDGGLTIGNSLGATSTTEASDPFDSLI